MRVATNAEAAAPLAATVMLLQTAGTSSAGDMLRPDDDAGDLVQASPHERAVFVKWPRDGKLRGRLDDAVGGHAKALTLYDKATRQIHGVLWINLAPTPALQVNSRATRIAKMCGAMMPGGRIIGDAVFSGPPDATSEVTSVPGKGENS